MDRSTLGHNLRPLERDGLVALAESDADRHWKHVTLTGKGRAKCARAYSLWREAQERFEKRFGESSAADLRDVLLSITADTALASSASAESTES